MKKLSNMPELAALWSTAQHIPRGATTIHFTFSPGDAETLRNYFGQTRRHEGIISCDDDYAFGSINPADPAARGEWVKTHLPLLPEMYDVWPLPSTAEFWATVASTQLRRVVLGLTTKHRGVHRFPEVGVAARPRVLRGHRHHRS